MNTRYFIAISWLLVCSIIFVLLVTCPILNQKVQVSASLRQHIDHDPILFGSDNDFISTATVESWPGDGTATNPYLIEGYRIVGDPHYQILIMNTTVHFQIINCYVSGGVNALSLYNVSNCVVENNVVAQSSDTGIMIGFSSNISILDNTIRDCSQYGLSILQSENITVTNNHIRANTMGGIHLGWAHNNSLVNNTLRNGQVGIALARDYGYGGSNNNQIIGNDIFYNFDGIVVMESRENTISNNVIHDNEWTGITIYNSNSNQFSNNSFVNILYYGIEMANSTNNSVFLNDFINVNPCKGGSQAVDDSGVLNIFSYNYWDNWISPDEDNDGIIDYPYEIDGSSTNTDSFPLTTRNNPLTVTINPFDCSEEETFPEETYPEWTFPEEPFLERLVRDLINRYVFFLILGDVISVFVLAVIRPKKFKSLPFRFEGTELVVLGGAITLITGFFTVTLLNYLSYILISVIPCFLVGITLIIAGLRRRQKKELIIVEEEVQKVPPVDYSYCPQCGTPANPEDKFCMECGISFIKDVNHSG